MNDNEKPLAAPFRSDNPALLEAVKAQWELDRQEAGPKSPFDKILYRGVLIESRFSVASEFAEIRTIVDALPDIVRARITSIWCDSRAGSDYTVTIAENRWIEGLDAQIRAIFVEVTSGFNGLSITCGSAFFVSFDPWWPGDKGL
jgi:hypothetical protein